MAHAQWTAIVLAGGRSSRFGSDKLAAILRGDRLIDLVISGIPGHVPVIVVGPDPGPFKRRITVVREDPAYGGPVAAIAAALPHVATALAVIIAADMPGAAPFLGELARSIPDDADGLVPVDSSGRLQMLCGAYRIACLDAAIRSASDGDASGLPMHSIVSQLSIDTVPWPDERTWDVDTPEDLALGKDVLAIESNDGVADEYGEGGDRKG